MICIKNSLTNLITWFKNDSGLRIGLGTDDKKATCLTEAFVNFKSFEQVLSIAMFNLKFRKQTKVKLQY